MITTLLEKPANASGTVKSPVISSANKAQTDTRSARKRGIKKQMVVMKRNEKNQLHICHDYCPFNKTF